MSQPPDPAIDAAFDALADVVRDRLSRNLRIRRNLPGDGRLRIDRQLPFLCIYRSPPVGDDPGTRDLVTSEAAYLFASGETPFDAGLRRLCRTIGEVLVEHFGGFLFIEIWAEDDRAESSSPFELLRPGFRVVVPEGESSPGTVEAIEAGLRAVRLHGLPAEVRISPSAAAAPPGMRPLATACAAGCVALGLAVRPVYRELHTGAVYPVVLQSLRRQLATVVRKSVFAFSGQQNGQEKVYYESLGPTTLVKAARLVDQQLCEVSQSFDFVLQTVPVNTESAWREFHASGYRQAPTFHYRPLPYHPALLKRQLFDVAIDRIEDVTLIQLFEQKQDHVDRQLTALKNIDSPAFLYDSIHLYGQPDAALVQLAEAVLQWTQGNEGPEEPSHGDRQESGGRSHESATDVSCDAKSAERSAPPGANNSYVHTDEIVAAAREQIDLYHRRLPGFLAAVQVRPDVAATMMVARDQLLVSSTAVLPRRRLLPLLHHEIGTHLLTYFNGRQQRFQQLYAGLAGYEELQEGLAVLAEFLAGGLTRARLRTLACRVLAVEAMIDGQSFVETFHLLHDQHRLAAKLAFMTTLRVYRGGGLTKDAIYLRGLRDLLEYLRDGHDLEPLYVGKIALAHVPLVQELRRRDIIEPPALLPRFWDDPATQQRLAQCRGRSLLDLVEHAL
jgi:uncharacterized protein (TIGR02421 family)